MHMNLRVLKVKLFVFMRASSYGKVCSGDCSIAVCMYACMINFIIFNLRINFEKTIHFGKFCILKSIDLKDCRYCMWLS